MHTIQLEIPDDLAKALVPYEDQLLELLQLGLRQRLEQGEYTRLAEVLRASGRVTSPKPYTDSKLYKRRTPLPTRGKPASELITEQRGTL